VSKWAIPLLVVENRALLIDFLGDAQIDADQPVGAWFGGLNPPTPGQLPQALRASPLGPQSSKVGGGGLAPGPPDDRRNPRSGSARGPLRNCPSFIRLQGLQRNRPSDSQRLVSPRSGVFGGGADAG